MILKTNIKNSKSDPLREANQDRMERCLGLVPLSYCIVHLILDISISIKKSESFSYLDKSLEPREDSY